MRAECKISKEKNKKSNSKAAQRRNRNENRSEIEGNRRGIEGKSKKNWRGEGCEGITKGNRRGIDEESKGIEGYRRRAKSNRRRIGEESKGHRKIIEKKSKFAASWGGGGDAQVTRGAAIEFASAKRITQLATGHTRCMQPGDGRRRRSRGRRRGHACCNFR